MNDDLISRKALKNAVENLVAGGEERLKDYYENGSKSEENEWIGGVYDAWELIVNAPTVDFEKLGESLRCQIRAEYGSCDDCELSCPRNELIKLLDSERQQGEWIPVGERLPEGKIEPTTNDFELVLCSTVWGIVRPYKFGKPIGHDKAHFWSGAGVMDDYVIAWMPLPETYKEAENENY